jgi:hypothetical protein
MREATVALAADAADDEESTGVAGCRAGPNHWGTIRVVPRRARLSVEPR